MLQGMSRRVFLYWAAYFDVREGTDHQKWEYYIAQLNCDMLSLVDGAPRKINSKLISFDLPEESKSDDRQQELDEAFLDSVSAISKIKSKFKEK